MRLSRGPVGSGPSYDGPSVRTATGPSVEWIDAADAGRGRPTGSPLRAQRLAALIALAVIVALVVLVVDRDGPLQGAQVDVPPYHLANAEDHEWRLLSTVDGSVRSGWPQPMISIGDEICFGFANEALVARPSLGRCVDRAAIGTLEDHQLASMLTVSSGFDAWHVLLFAAPVTSIEVRTSGGDRIGGDRIHVDGTTVALRLAVADPLGALTWKHGRLVVRCEPPADAVETGRLCPPA